MDLLHVVTSSYPRTQREKVSLVFILNLYIHILNLCVCVSLTSHFLFYIYKY